MAAPGGGVVSTISPAVSEGVHLITEKGLEIKRWWLTVSGKEKGNMGPSTHSPFGGLYGMFHEHSGFIRKPGSSHAVGTPTKMAARTGLGFSCERQRDRLLRAGDWTWVLIK